MSDRNTADNWRLEESDDRSSRWKLEETEQNQISQWELQDEFAEEAGWQPVDYTREPEQRQSGSWILPSLVGLALIAVVAYGAWIGLSRLQPNMIGQLLGQGDLLTPVPTVVSSSSIAAITPEVAAPTEAPVEPLPTTVIAEPTLPPAEVATAAPAPVQVEEQFATITAQYGVNARPNPSTDGDALQILEEGGEYLVLDTTDEWLQVALPIGQLAWISSDPEFVTVRAETMDVTRANQFRTQVGAPLLESESVASLPSATTPITATDTPIPGALPAATAEAAPTNATTVDTSISGTVNIIGGLNARANPNTDGELISLLPNETLLDLTGRTANSEWVRTTLSETFTVWLFAEYVDVTGGVDSLPVVEVPGISETSAITTAVPSDETTSDVGAEQPATGTIEATASVNAPLGAAVRAAPASSADAIDTATNQSVLIVTGRSADNLWLQIDMTDTQGWVEVSAVNLSVDLASLPVATP